MNQTSGHGNPTRSQLVQGSTLSAAILLVLALYGMVNYLAMRHYKRFDWTSSQLYSLSEKSLAVVRDIDQEIDMVIFLNPGSELYEPVDELLSRYAAANPKFIKKREIDRDRNLLEAQKLLDQYSIERDNVVVIANADDRRVIDELDLAEYDYSGMQYGQQPKLTGFKGEQLITSALLGLAETEGPKALFTTGHGEAQLDAGNPRSLSRARDILGRDNFRIEEWSTLGATEVPSDTDLLIVAGPTTNFLPPELDLLSSHLDAGGRLLMMLDPVFAEGSDTIVDLGFTDWLAGYGIEIRGDVVIDPSSELPFFGPETIYTEAFGSHPIVDPLAEDRLRVLMPVARSVTSSGDAAPGTQVSELLRTSEAGWGETDLSDPEQIAQGTDDVPGPVSLGVAVSFGPEAKNETESDPGETDPSEADPSEAEPSAEENESGSQGQPPEARLVVFGDFDFASDAQVTNGANRGLLLNTLNWLAEREELIEIAAREPEQTTMTLSESELYSVFFAIMILLPGLAVAAGIWIYMVRRR